MSLKNDTTMKTEQEIDAALRMLSEAQPPAAMTSRIHGNLNAAAATSEQGRSRGLFWLPATCAAMATILLAVLIQPHIVREKRTAATAMATNSASPRLASSLPALIPAESSRERNASTRIAHSISHARRHPAYRHAANLFNYPLTQQEKLLVKFVRTAKPDELRDLNPEYQAKVEAQQEAEFAAYVNSGDSYAASTEPEKTNSSIQE